MQIKAKVSEACVYIHKSIVRESKVFYTEHKRQYYVTPILYVEFLKIFKKLFESKKMEYIVRLSIRLDTIYSKSNTSFFAIDKSHPAHQWITKNIGIK
jgi:hypothetical protein